MGILTLKKKTDPADPPWRTSGGQEVRLGRRKRRLHITVAAAYDSVSRSPGILHRRFTEREQTMSQASSNDQSEPTRRDFLATASVAAVTMASVPFVHASDKSGTRPPVIGVKGHEYECHHDWGQVPDHIKWKDTHGVAVDASGLIYFTHRAPAGVDTIVVFEPTGKFVTSFGKEFAGGGHGIDIRNDGGEEFLYLAFNAPHRKIMKMTLKGEKVWETQQPVESGKYIKVEQFNPTNIAFAPDGGFYVADGYGSHFIHQYDQAGKWVRTWGGGGKGVGQFQTPHGIWLDNRPGKEVSIVVADRANARLQYFTLDGQPLADRMVSNTVSFPAHFDIRGAELLVADLHARLTILDKDNQVVVHLGYDPNWTKQVLEGFKMRTQPTQWQAGRFVHPHDACWDKSGNIYVAEWVATGRISFLKHVG